jgi:hypothetical protein
MGALVTLLALSAAIGYVLCSFSWPALLIAEPAIALLSAAILHGQGFGPVAGIASTVACLTVSQVAFFAGRCRCAGLYEEQINKEPGKPPKRDIPAK